VVQDKIPDTPSPPRFSFPFLPPYFQPPLVMARGLGECYSSPNGSGQSLVAKRILVLEIYKSVSFTRMHRRSVQQPINNSHFFTIVTIRHGCNLNRNLNEKQLPHTTLSSNGVDFFPEWSLISELPVHFRTPGNPNSTTFNLPPTPVGNSRRSTAVQLNQPDQWKPGNKLTNI